MGYSLKQFNKDMKQLGGMIENFYSKKGGNPDEMNDGDESEEMMGGDMRESDNSDNSDGDNGDEPETNDSENSDNMGGGGNKKSNKKNMRPVANKNKKSNKKNMRPVANKNTKKSNKKNMRPVANKNTKKSNKKNMRPMNAKKNTKKNTNKNKKNTKKEDKPKRRFKVITVEGEPYAFPRPYTGREPKIAAKRAGKYICERLKLNKSCKIKSFELKETTRGSDKRVYGPYTGEWVKLDKVKKLSLKGKDIVQTHQFVVKLKKE